MESLIDGFEEEHREELEELMVREEKLQVDLNYHEVVVFSLTVELDNVRQKIEQLVGMVNEQAVEDGW